MSAETAASEVGTWRETKPGYPPYPPPSPTPPPPRFEKGRGFSPSPPSATIQHAPQGRQIKSHKQESIPNPKQSYIAGSRAESLRRGSRQRVVRSVVRGLLLISRPHTSRSHAASHGADDPAEGSADLESSWPHRLVEVTPSNGQGQGPMSTTVLVLVHCMATFSIQGGSGFDD